MGEKRIRSKSPDRFVLEHLLFVFDKWGIEPNATKERMIEYIKKLLERKLK